MNKTGFIGVGNMGSAIVSGMIGSGKFGCDDIILCGHSVPEEFRALNINVTNVTDLTAKSDYIILCIKPNGFDALLNEIKTVPGYRSKIYVSIAAGIKISDIASVLGDVKIVRTMPNLALMCTEGMTSMCRSENVTDSEFDYVKSMFACAGRCAEVPEKLFGACTAVSGSGPAYVFMFIEALADAAVKHGVKRSDAYLFASQTLLGSAKLQLESGEHPAVLKDRVCSPGGTTIDAVAVLEDMGLRSAVISAVDACVKKSEEM